MIDKVNKATKEYAQNGKRGMKDLNGEKSSKQMRTDLKTCLEYGDEKVALAVQTYELVCTTHLICGQIDFKPRLTINDIMYVSAT